MSEPEPDDTDPAGVALLAAIGADPDDLDARLVYADHLSQRGDPRGEWIALHCRLAVTPEHDDAWPALARRERTVWLTLGATWRTGDVQTFERGLPAVVGATADTLATVATRFPTATRVVISEPFMPRAPAGGDAGYSQAWRSFVRDGAGWRVAGFSGVIRRAGYPTPAPRFDEVGPPELALSSSGRGHLQLASIPPMIFGRRRLALHCLAMSGPLAAPADAFAGLERIELTSMSPLIAAWIVGGARDRTLTELVLRGVELGPAHPLLELPRFHGVTRLSLAGSRIGTAGLARLLPQLTSVEELDLSNSNLDAAGVRLLSASPCAARLRRLDVSLNPLGADGAAALASAFPSVTRLRLARAGLGDDGACALASGSLVSQLVTLSVHANEVHGRGLHALAVAFGPRLLVVDLRGNRIDHVAMAALAAGPSGFEPIGLRWSQAGGVSGAALEARLRLGRFAIARRQARYTASGLDL